MVIHLTNLPRTGAPSAAADAGDKRVASRLLTAARIFFVAAATVWALGSSAPAQAQERAQPEAFLGFSYVRFDVEDFLSIDTYGIQGGVAWFFNERLGLDVEVGNVEGNLNVPVIAIFPTPDVDFSATTVLAGVRYRFGPQGRLLPSVRALAGLARGSVGVELEVPDVTAIDTSETENALGVALGAALDLDVTERLAWRIVQPDLLITTFGNDTQANIRLATGLVVRF